MLGHVQKQQQQMVGAAIRQVFAAPSREDARSILQDVVARLERVAPKVAGLLEDAEPDLLAFLDFPQEDPSAEIDGDPLPPPDATVAASNLT
jgi:putative transposase